jgi:predicted protein tyrosine phosphatase
MPQIIVTPLKHMPEVVVRHRASHLISLMGPDHPIHRPGMIAKANHLSLAVNDIAFKGSGKLIGPSDEHIQSIMDFARSWDQQAPMVIHCWLGQSRSPAAALIAALAINPQLDDLILTRALRSASEFANPNKRMVKLADNLIQRSGRLVEAVKQIGNGKKADLSPPFVLDFKSL